MYKVGFKMTTEIRDRFDTLFSIEFDDKLYKAIQMFETSFISNSEDHIEFFGGKLLGCYSVRFSNSELKEWYDIFSIEESDIKDAIKSIKSIDKSRIVTSDSFNVSSMYLSHRFLISNKLDNKTAIKAATLVLVILNMRYFTGIYNHFFQYPIDKHMAQALYARLTYKYLIKKLHNWKEVFEYRAVSMVHENQLHHNTIKTMNNDEDVLKAIADSYGRIKDMMKNIYREFIEVHKSGERIYINNDSTVNEEGIEVLRDRTTGIESYKNYILDVVKDTNSFIKNDLVNIVMDLMEGVRSSQFVELLEWFTTRTFTSDETLVIRFIETNLTFSYDYIEKDKSLLHNTKDLGLFITTLRGAYMSSRSVDDNLLKLRDDGDKIVKKALKLTNSGLISSLRTSLLLYLNLRTFTKEYYRG